MSSFSLTEISHLLEAPTSDLADVAVSGLFAAGYQVQGQAGSGPAGIIIDAWKRYGEPFITKSQSAATKLWLKTLDATARKHGATPEDALTMAAAADFVREVFARNAEGGFDPMHLSLHSLLAFCIVLSRASGGLPWDPSDKS